MSNSWFEVINQSVLEQGDLITDCKIFRPVHAESQKDDSVVTIAEEIHDVIILTQTCDIENRNVEEVLVARVVTYGNLIAEFGGADIRRSRTYRKTALDNVIPAYLLLQERTIPPILEWSLVDFHNLFTIPRSLLSEITSGKGDRLRLVPPYKEHLAQSFAKYMMRVALPATLDAFESFKP